MVCITCYPKVKTNAVHESMTAKIKTQAILLRSAASMVK